MSETWEWLVHSPLFVLLLTLAAYRLGREVRDLTGGHALAQPVLVAIVVVGGVITAIDLDYADYRDGTEILVFWLGPATVALAIPLHRQAHRLRGFVVPMLVAIPLGAAVSIASAILLVRVLGGDDLLARTTAPKAATTPVAIALAESNGGIAALAAVLAILVGILGAVAGPAVLNLLRVKDHRARGLAQGAVSHGIGASRMLADDETEGAFAGLSMGLTALAMSLLLPALVALLL
ncbi:membrane protein [Nocardioides szechwanensis]|uniref:Putative effector of murein hydrolase n=1 Tax=Nocardioides szechwanensis TaxID=1005944 RepID=A0A1G9Z1K6_9ACTN|nr:LrgB family protein [Nocardioides szechwanensis]GEP33782.1 membrane protein [Nocardioides szechwanensis]SDN15190.1 Putative effector of murein hydrolase [Nocardioides szechwanensis]